ncbi:MAG: hypothetical protein N3D11_14745 [Candidatus Sumerlaeia bacterium]|nr:hypothetical protein [Candidatus Sumerlaeia bacterium]
MHRVILFWAAALGAVMSLSPACGDVYDDTVARAEALWNIGQKAEAVRLYGSVWDLRRSDVERQLIYAERSADVGNYRWSLNFYKVVEQQAAGNPALLHRVYMGYARTYRKAGQPERAQPYEDKAAELRRSGKVPDSPPRPATPSGAYTEPAKVAGSAKVAESKTTPKPVPASSIVAEPTTPPSAETPPGVAPVKPMRFLKKRIAVAEIEDTVRRPGMANYGRQIHDMLVTELQATQRFIVVERQNLKGILDEQDLAASGRVAEGAGPKTGQMLGAQLMVKASITDFEEQSASGYGVGIGPVDWDRSQRTIRVGMDLRIYNAETGVVLASEAVSASKVQSGGGIGVTVDIFDFRRRESQNSTLGFVTRELIQKALERILAASEKVPWTARVMKASESEVYFNAGAEAGVAIGQRYRVVSVGEELRDPDTGEVLAAEEKPIGEIEVTRVEPKYAIGRIISKKGEIKRLDRVVARE